MCVFVIYSQFFIIQFSNLDNDLKVGGYNLQNNQNKIKLDHAI